MDRRELAAWLRLTLTPGVGNRAARKLLAAFALPEAVHEQTRSSLTLVVGAALADALAARPERLDQQVDATWDWLQRRDGADDPCRQIVALGDPRYPRCLLDIDDPPLLLYLLGHADLLEHTPLSADESTGAAPDSINARLRRSIAVVGSRNPTPQGAINARQFARALGESGLVIVSGLALGIDAAAHEGAIDAAVATGRTFATVAVVGTGLDRVYPKAHRDLAHRIARRGMIVSEYPLGTAPHAANFPQRNRIIAGLARGALVVEAALRSGSLITARLAAEQGKDVFAIPGSIHSIQSHGCHALIRQGAKLVESARDVLEDLEPDVDAAAPSEPAAAPVRTSSAAGNAAADDPVLRALGHDPCGLDALQARTGLTTAELQARLMALELEQTVARLPGGLFQRMHQG